MKFSLKAVKTFNENTKSGKSRLRQVSNMKWK